ncbi:hypothetical protein GLOTRDRAFT_137581 [Gloeophyllum trabeum ATCC 11539]|uniref:BTB domain-containing protein n=1 Tax=Gloeophyllum trabeum (strain ATCC 11539 / FP-39264 / Madison 617) TaxID=670483 RepID=S7RVC3_GLOTA|nr:uncharacterized protein GLOTRDRAFT_137581 [Gloeophyllum trabeum ATCC 11539]EPQ57189.1 hypothetical protein GLOTRDRAFT_137581 [Gloeophyllum trabeum ATCC 11539]
MERIGEDTETTSGIVSKFRLKGDARSLSDPASNDYGEPTYSEPCGYNHRFIIQWRRSGFTRQPWIHIDPSRVNPKLGQLTVTVLAESTGGTPPHFLRAMGGSPNGEGFAVSQSGVSRTTILRPPYSVTHLATMKIIGTNLAQLTISFNVRAENPSEHRMDVSTAPADARVASSLRSALRSSLDEGDFIDTKIYGFSRRMVDGQVSGPLPIYANSTILKAKSTYFETMFSRAYFTESSVNELGGGALQPGESSCSAEEYGYDSDSDLDAGEDDPDGDSAAPIRRRGPGRTAHVKDIAHKTLRTFVWYCYTGEVVFSPLTSEGKEQKKSERLEAQSAIAAMKPPSCSPKSMYRLADKYGIADLEDRAFDELRNRLTVHNILDELFSTFTSRYERIRHMEIDFICSKLDCPEISDGLPRVVAAFGADSTRLPNFEVLSSLIQKLLERRNSSSNRGRVGASRFATEDVYIPEHNSGSPFDAYF